MEASVFFLADLLWYGYFVDGFALLFGFDHFFLLNIMARCAKMSCIVDIIGSINHDVACASPVYRVYRRCRPCFHYSISVRFEDEPNEVARIRNIQIIIIMRNGQGKVSIQGRWGFFVASWKLYGESMRIVNRKEVFFSNACRWLVNSSGVSRRLDKGTAVFQMDDF